VGYNKHYSDVLAVSGIRVGLISYYLRESAA